MSRVPQPIVPLLPTQIDAANAIHDRHMPGWAGTDRALTLLAESVPGLETEAVTLKAAAVDRLYYTRHYRLGDAIGRIIEVLGPEPARPSTAEEGVTLVERIAPIEVGNKVRWHWSFASKFGHWFLHDSLPIYDAWAIRAVRFHFGRIRWRTTAYRDIAEHVDALRAASGLSCTTREMDRFFPGMCGLGVGVGPGQARARRWWVCSRATPRGGGASGCSPGTPRWGGHMTTPRPRIGTCSWRFPSWTGLVYSAAEGIDHLAEYAGRYDTVEVATALHGARQTPGGDPPPQAEPRSVRDGAGSRGGARHGLTRGVPLPTRVPPASGSQPVTLRDASRASRRAGRGDRRLGSVAVVRARPSPGRPEAGHPPTPDCRLSAPPSWPRPPAGRWRP